MNNELVRHNAEYVQKTIYTYYLHEVAIYSGYCVEVLQS